MGRCEVSRFGSVHFLVIWFLSIAWMQLLVFVPDFPHLDILCVPLRVVAGLVCSPLEMLPQGPVGWELFLLFAIELLKLVVHSETDPMLRDWVWWWKVDMSKLLLCL